jgi:hypothetical protein
MSVQIRTAVIAETNVLSGFVTAGVAFARDHWHTNRDDARKRTPGCFFINPCLSTMPFDGTDLHVTHVPELDRKTSTNQNRGDGQAMAFGLLRHLRVLSSRQVTPSFEIVGNQTLPHSRSNGITLIAPKLPTSPKINAR